MNYEWIVDKNNYIIINIVIIFYINISFLRVVRFIFLKKYLVGIYYSIYRYF